MQDKVIRKKIISTKKRRGSEQRVCTILLSIMVYFPRHFRKLYADKYYSLRRTLLEIVIFLPGQRPL